MFFNSFLCFPFGNKTVTQEDVTQEELGGAKTHTSVSGKDATSTCIKSGLTLYMVIKYCQLSWSRKLAIVKSFKGDILSVSPSSFALTRGYYARNISFGTLYSGQFASSTQLIVPNYPIKLSHQYSTTVSLETYPLYSFNPLHPNISMHILHTVLYAFPKLLTWKICLLIKSFFVWWPFLLFS